MQSSSIADRGHQRAQAFPRDPGKTVALRRRRLCHPLVPLADAGEFAGHRLWPGRRLRAAQGARARHRYRHRRHRRDQYAGARRRASSPRCAPTAVSAWSAWSACSRTSIPRSLHIAEPLRAAGIAGDDRRLPRLRHAGDVPGRDGGSAGSPRHRHHAVRRRGRRPHGRGDARCRRAARSKPIYNYINDLPALEESVTPFLPGNSVRKTIGNVTTLRRRPRLPVPMLVLHHHQRAGPQIAPPQRPTTSSASCARISRTASTASSSPTTISPATRTGSRSSTASSSCARKTAWTCAS